MDVMDADKIVLDRKSFEALAVESRVRILKALKERRKTLTELSEELSMSVSAVKEHLENLETVSLVVKKDDGHKWKYYELTRKGAEIVGPKELKVWIVLSLSLIAFAASLLAMMGPSPLDLAGTAPMTYSAMPDASLRSPGTGGQGDGTGSGTEADTLALTKSAPEPATVAANGGPASASGYGNGSDLVQGTADTAIADENVSAQSDQTPSFAVAEDSIPPSASTGPLIKQDLEIPLAVAFVSGLTLLGCAAILVKNRSKWSASP